jgi:hypothetical protein
MKRSSIIKRGEKAIFKTLVKIALNVTILFKIHLSIHNILLDREMLTLTCHADGGTDDLYLQ